ncbi:MAG: hypothetical protein Kow0098_26770 [Ignavibacteriaceae bacterium]
MRIVLLVSLILIIFAPYHVNAQSFGFGCLGFVSGFGGYSYQIYEPSGLNNYISRFNQLRAENLSEQVSQFRKAEGYRIGINFFRANFEGFFITTKGFYQRLQEEKVTSENTIQGLNNYSFETLINNWSIGIDFGIDISKALSWKIIDGALHFNNAKFIRTDNLPGQTISTTYKSDHSQLGYSLGTGFILDIAEEYISLEGLVAFSEIEIKELKTDGGLKLTETEDSDVTMTDFIDAGGFNAVIQLNIGFPL